MSPLSGSLIRESPRIMLAKEKELFICTTHHGNKTKKTSNILLDVDNFFQAKEKSYLSKGINIKQCFFDPGFGYGKTPLENIFMMTNINFFKKENRKILTGTSRKKSFADFFKDTCWNLPFKLELFHLE